MTLPAVGPLADLPDPLANPPNALPRGWWHLGGSGHASPSAQYLDAEGRMAAASLALGLLTVYETSGHGWYATPPGKVIHTRRTSTSGREYEVEQVAGAMLRTMGVEIGSTTTRRPRFVVWRRPCEHRDQHKFRKDGTVACAVCPMRVPR